MYSAKVIADSINSITGDRITTLELTYPRFVHSEVMTHRMLSRNSASSRAIPVEKMLIKVTEDPVIPVYWGKNQKGMQANEELSVEQQKEAEAIWIDARDSAIHFAKLLISLGVHKQIANRILEPWYWITVLTTATDWDNFFHLRIHKDAHPELYKIVEMAKFEMDSSSPISLLPRQWHLPFIKPEDRIQFGIKDLVKISTGKCARVSYLTHDGLRNPVEDIFLNDRLVSGGHMSPLEHPAMALSKSQRVGNFKGWKQARKFIPFEDDMMGHLITQQV